MNIVLYNCDCTINISNTIYATLELKSGKIINKSNKINTGGLESNKLFIIFT